MYMDEINKENDNLTAKQRACKNLLFKNEISFNLCKKKKILAKDIFIIIQP